MLASNESNEKIVRLPFLPCDLPLSLHFVLDMNPKLKLDEINENIVLYLPSQTFHVFCPLLSVMALVNATNSAFSGKGKYFSCLETTIKLAPYASSQQALSTFCLVGKVVAPMVVNEATVMDFVDKTWKFKVNVVALYETTKIPNCFEFGFARAEDRAWALDHGPRCVRGYSLILHVWTPRKSLTVSFDSMRVWMQIQTSHGIIFQSIMERFWGGKPARSSPVELDDGSLALWRKFL
ncbi:hypothetical protein G4B88_012552 [Cannabis sativa]|uniref:DUF4283 domain-containing protein n=1 Tax=Cannabis sativa TaxID=3483 RepID=A0A7J6EPH3_CANSA|nr:hypothetical protein G4B88_012552 [Cannabis sativa]